MGIFSTTSLHSPQAVFKHNDLKGNSNECGIQNTYLRTLFGQGSETFSRHNVPMQTTEEKVDTSKALDASLVDIKSSGTESVEQDTSSRSGNDAHSYDAYIRPII
ncbi:hypothetical protein Tco_0619904 [Tanacetum coccineum]